MMKTLPNMVSLESYSDLFIEFQSNNSPDTSFSPIKAYDSKIQAFIKDIEDEFNFKDEEVI